MKLFKEDIYTSYKKQTEFHICQMDREGVPFPVESIAPPYAKLSAVDNKSFFASFRPSYYSHSFYSLSPTVQHSLRVTPTQISWDMFTLRNPELKDFYIAIGIFLNKLES